MARNADVGGGGDDDQDDDDDDQDEAFEPSMFDALRLSRRAERRILGALAARVQRRDTFALRLDAAGVPPPRDDIPNQTREERRQIMHRVSLKLER